MVHRSWRKAAVAALVSCGLPWLLSGCLLAAAAAGVAVYGAISYHENEAWMDFHADLKPVWSAAMESLYDTGFGPDRSKQPGPTDGEIKAGEATVKVERQPGDFTRVRVRVGTFDNEENKRKAGLILDGMKKRLVK